MDQPRDETRRERGNGEREFEANNGSSRGSDRARVENQASPTDSDLETKHEHELEKRAESVELAYRNITLSDRERTEEKERQQGDKRAKHNGKRQRERAVTVVAGFKLSQSVELPIASWYVSHRELIQIDNFFSDNVHICILSKVSMSFANTKCKVRLWALGNGCMKVRLTSRAYNLLITKPWTVGVGASPSSHGMAP